MRKNDEMYQMFSKQGLLVAYGYLVFTIAGYVSWQTLHGHYEPFWYFVMGSQGMIWIIATQILQRLKLGKGALSTGAIVTLIMSVILLGLMVVVYGIALLDWMIN